MKKQIIDYLPAKYIQFIEWHFRIFNEAPGKITILNMLIANAIRKRPLALIKLTNQKNHIKIRMNSSDYHVVDQIFGRKEYDFKMRNIPEVIIDAGANIGMATLFFKKRFPDAKIIALEPDHDNFTLLNKNTKHLTNVISINAGLWSHHTNLKLSNPDAEPWAYHFEETMDVNSIMAFGLDDLVKKYNLEKIDLLKIDIEGAECQVFRNPGKWLEHVTTVVVECHDELKNDCSQIVKSALEPIAKRIEEIGDFLVFHLK